MRRHRIRRDYGKLTLGGHLRTVAKVVRMMEVKIRLQSECSVVPDDSVYMKLLLALDWVEQTWRHLRACFDVDCLGSRG